MDAREYTLQPFNCLLSSDAYVYTYYHEYQFLNLFITIDFQDMQLRFKFISDADLRSNTNRNMLFSLMDPRVIKETLVKDLMYIEFNWYTLFKWNTEDLSDTHITFMPEEILLIEDHTHSGVWEYLLKRVHELILTNKKLYLNQKDYYLLQESTVLGFKPYSLFGHEKEFINNTKVDNGLLYLLEE